MQLSQVFWGQGPFILAHQIRISVILSHVRKFYIAYPYQPVGKINEPPQVCCMLAAHRSVFKWHHHVTFQRIQDFCEAFFYVFPLKFRFLVLSKKKNPLFVWGWDRKVRPSWSPFVITRQSLWCQSVILVADFSIPPSYSLWILILTYDSSKTSMAGTYTDPHFQRKIFQEWNFNLYTRPCQNYCTVQGFRQTFTKSGYD